MAGFTIEGRSTYRELVEIVARRGGFSPYHSKLKQAILAELIKDPNLSTREISRRIDRKDRKHSVEAPISWRTNKGDPFLLSVYDARGTGQAKLKTEISKVRSEFKKSLVKACLSETEISKLQREVREIKHALKGLARYNTPVVF